MSGASLNNSRDKSGPDERQAGRSWLDNLRAPNNTADGLESSRLLATRLKLIKNANPLNLLLCRKIKSFQPFW